VHKIPVFATAAAAYRFLFGDLGTILRLSWFPLLLATIIQYVAEWAQRSFARSVIENGVMVSRTDGGVLPWAWQALDFLVLIVATAVVAVALHRVILFNDRHPGRWLHLSFGKVEGLFAVLPIVFFAVWYPLIFAMVVPWFGLGLLPFTYAILIGLLLLIMVVAVRMSLIFPLTVVEGRYDFAGAWALTRGNFWRLVGLWLVVAIPMIVVALVVAYAVLFRPLLSTGAIPAIDAPQWQLTQAVFSCVWSIISDALGVAVLSYSYKAVVGRRPDYVLTR